jgi:hypothetical protein
MIFSSSITLLSFVGLSLKDDQRSRLGYEKVESPAVSLFWIIMIYVNKNDFPPCVDLVVYVHPPLFGHIFRI